jgi:hypothetical protein
MTARASTARRSRFTLSAMAPSTSGAKLWHLLGTAEGDVSAGHRFGFCRIGRP